MHRALLSQRSKSTTTRMASNIVSRRPCRQLSAAQARRMALAAQGFAEPRPGAEGKKVDRRHFRAVLDRLSAVQIDTVNVIARAHLLTFFARLGPYDQARAGALAARQRRGVRVLGPRRLVPARRPAPGPALQDGGGLRRRRPTRGLLRLLQRPARATSTRSGRRCGSRGRSCPPTCATPGPRTKGTWWDWDHAEAGPRAAVLGRRDHRGPRPAVRAHLRHARAGAAGGGARRADADRRRGPARSCCAGRRRPWASATADATSPTTTARCRPKAKPVVEAMAADGELDAGARSRAGRSRPTCGRRPSCPRRVQARALLAPFDSLVWERDRAAARLRLPLPHRDLHAGAEAGVRLLRAAVPPRRPARRPGRPQGRPQGRGAARAGGVGRARHRPRRGGRRAGRRARTSSPASSASTTSSSRTAATSPPPSPSPSAELPVGVPSGGDGDGAGDGVLVGLRQAHRPAVRPPRPHRVRHDARHRQGRTDGGDGRRGGPRRAGARPRRRPTPRRSTPPSPRPRRVAGGALDVVVNNAGVELRGPIEACADDEVLAQFDTNVFGVDPGGPGRAARRCGRAGSGVIVNVSSIAGLVARPFGGIYSASKHALEAISESLHHEVRPVRHPGRRRRAGPVRDRPAGQRHRRRRLRRRRRPTGSVRALRRRRARARARRQAGAGRGRGRDDRRRRLRPRAPACATSSAPTPSW